MPRRKNKKARAVDPHDVDMTAMFGDLIRERSLYAVLDALVQACRSRAEKKVADVGDAEKLHPVSLELVDSEVEFLHDVAKEITYVADGLRERWDDRAPVCADGDFLRSYNYMRHVAKAYMQGLVATLNDPDTALDERQKVAETLNKEAQGTIWVNAETGELSSQAAEMFRAATSVLVDPNAPEEHRSEIAAQLKAFVGIA
jgi:hypothetical protein